MKSIFPALLGLSLLSCTGCGEVITVSGTVTRAGKPVEAATILFVPKSGTNGPTVSGRIAKGRYSISAKDGLQTGKYIVKVSLPNTRHHFERPSKHDQEFEVEGEILGENTHINLEL
jgi:hypothetical protein